MPTTVSGVVIDDNRRPVGRAKISRAGKNIGETRDDGFFAVEAGRARGRVALTFTADGYVPNTKVYDTRADVGINTVVVWPFAYRVRFDPSRDLDVDLGGSRIRVPENAIAGRRRGKGGDGKVEIRFTWFDVTNEFQRGAISGDFSGLSPNGSLQRLDSFGAFAFDLRDAKGEPADLRQGSAIELSIGVPPRLAARAPERIGLLGFDAAQGAWTAAGGSFDLGRDRKTYVGVVKGSPGTFLMDDPLDTTCVRVKVTNSYDGSGLKSMTVTVNGSNYAFSVSTDGNGFACLVVARNSPFMVTAQGSPYGSGSFWSTPHPVTLVSPNIGSTGADCSDPALCPFVGVIPCDFVVAGGPGG